VANLIKFHHLATLLVAKPIATWEPQIRCYLPVKILYPSIMSPLYLPKTNTGGF